MCHPVLKWTVGQYSVVRNCLYRVDGVIYVRFLIISVCHKARKEKMSDISNVSKINTETRLQLLKQVRSRYNEDQRDLTKRELILYGRSGRTVSENLEQEVPSDAEHVSFFRIRLVLAVLIFAAVIFMDMNGIEMAGITAEKIFQAISADYEEVLDSWAEISQPSI